MALHEIVHVLEANSGKVHDLCVSEEFLARFDGYHSTDFPDLWTPLGFVDDSKVAYAKRADPIRFTFASLHRANSQYLTNIHTSGPAKQRPVAIARNT